MGTDKALLPWPPAALDSAGATRHTLLSASIAALKPFTDAIVVVVGNNVDSLAPLIAANGASLAQNPAPERGQFSSFQIGLREALKRGCDSAMITLVDSPPLSMESMTTLRVAFDKALAVNHWGVAPEHNGKRGHPLLANSDLIAAFLSAPVTSNAREVKHAHAALIESIPVADVLVSMDINTPEQYAAISRTEMKRS